MKYKLGHPFQTRLFFLYGSNSIRTATRINSLGSFANKFIQDIFKILIKLFVKCLSNPNIFSYNLFHLLELLNVDKIFAHLMVDIQKDLFKGIFVQQLFTEEE